MYWFFTGSSSIGLVPKSSFNIQTDISASVVSVEGCQVIVGPPGPRALQSNPSRARRLLSLWRMVLPGRRDPRSPTMWLRIDLRGFRRRHQTRRAPAKIDPSYSRSDGRPRDFPPPDSGSFCGRNPRSRRTYPETGGPRPSHHFASEPQSGPPEGFPVSAFRGSPHSHPEAGNHARATQFPAAEARDRPGRHRPQDRSRVRAQHVLEDLDGHQLPGKLKQGCTSAWAR